MNESIVPNMNGTWRVIPGHEGRDWLIRTDTVNPADKIHVTDPEPSGGMRGYGGRTLIFKLDNGGVYSAKGPWHSNSGALLRDTGVDLTNLHQTRVVVTAEDGTEVYAEMQPALGRFDRADHIGQTLANLRGEPLRVKSESYGGSSTRTITP